MRRISIPTLKFLVIICNNLLSIIEIRGLEKEIGSIDYGFFTVEYEDNISNIEENDKYYVVHLYNNQKMSFKMSNIDYNYLKDGKWWRTAPKQGFFSRQRVRASKLALPFAADLRRLADQ